MILLRIPDPVRSAYPRAARRPRIEVQIAADGRPEIAESYMVRLVSIMGGGSGQITSGTTEVTAQIPANDPRMLSAYRRISDPASVSEVDGQEVGFTVQWGDGGTDPDLPPTTLTVSYRLSGSAEGGADYRYPAGYDTDTDTGTLAIAISTYIGTLTMVVVGDTLDEDDESIVFELLEVVAGAEVATLPVNTSASVTIEDDDKSSLSVSASAASVNEEDEDRIVFTLSLLNDGAPTTRVLARDVRVGYTLSGDATGGGVDYSDPDGYGAGSGVLMLGAGEASSEVSITVVDDAVRENDETIVFALTAIEAGADLVELRATDTTRARVFINDDEGVMRNFYVTATSVSVAEGTTLAYTVGYAGEAISPTTPVSVAWAVMGSGTRPASAADFEEVSGSVLFESTDPREQRIILRAAADTLNEGTEEFTLRISEMDGRSRVYSTAREVVTTISDDPADELRISIMRSDSGDLIEGAAAEAERQADFVVRVGNSTATADLTIPLRVVHGAGVSADDYTLTPPAMVTIRQGFTTGTVTLVVADDNVNEGAESVQVVLGGVRGALGAAVVDASASSASATIAGNDPIEVSVGRLAGDVGGAEGTSAVFVVTLSGGESTLETVVDWDVSVSAAAGRAQAADFMAISGQARVPAGETTGRINVQVVDDALGEAAETYTLRLSNLVGGGTGRVALGATASVMAQIPADVSSQRLSVYSSPASVSEADGQEVRFTVQWGDGGSDPADTPPTTVTVSYRLSGSAEGGSDYRYPAGYDTDTDTGTLMIAISTYTGTVMMTIVGDTLDEDNESVAFELLEVVMGAEVATLPANTSASATIEDDDKSSLSVAASAASVGEGDGTIVFTLSLLNDGMRTTRTLARDVNVRYELSGDASSGGVDYTGASSGVVVLRAGEVSSEVSITVVDDAMRENDETIIFALAEIVAGADLVELRAADTTRVSVVINDNSPPVVFAPSMYSVTEGAGVVTATVRLAGNRRGGNFSVTGTVVALDDAAPRSRYDLSTAPVVFRLNQTTPEVQVLIPVIADEIPEDDETFSLRLLSFGHPGSAQTATVVIRDDDDIFIGFGRTSYSLEEGDSLSACIAMTMPAATTAVEREFSLAVSTRPGTAGTNDFTSFDGRILTFGDSTRSACFNFETTDDPIAEDGESMFFDLVTTRSLERVTINPAVSEVMIADNDPVTLGFADTGLAVVEGDDSTATVCVEITDPATIERSDFLLLLRTMDGSAMVGADYSAPTTPTLGPFGSGSRRECSDVAIIDDQVAEPSETFRLFVATSGSPVGVIVAPSSLTVTITDDDFEDVVRNFYVTATSVSSVDEANEDTVAFTVSLQTDAMAPARTSQVRVAYTLTGTAQGGGTDYTDPNDYVRSAVESSGVVVLGVGSDSADVSITVRDDNLNEAAETVIFSLTEIVSGATLAELRAADTTRTLVTIAASDPITVSVARKEGDTGGVEYDSGDVPTADAPSTATFVVTLAGGLGTEETVIDWELIAGGGFGQASLGDIVTATRGTQPSEDVIIPAGSTTGEIKVETAPDTIPEIAESYTVRLVSIMGGGSGQITLGTTEVTAQIPANDPRRLSVYRRDSGSVSETPLMPSGTLRDLRFTVQWDDNMDARTPTTLTVRYRLSGTAAGGADYRYPAGYDTDANSGTLAIAISTYTGTVIMAIVDDTLDEDDESVVFELLEVVMGAEVATLPANTSASATIEDDDKSSLSVSASAASVNEEDEDRIVFTLSLLNDGAPTTRTLARDVNVRYMLGGTATGDGTDYTGASSGVVVLRAGEASSEVSIMVVDDVAVENDETIVFALTAIEAGADLIELRAADTTRVSVFINDDDDVVRNFYVTATVVSVAEGMTLAYTVGYDGEAITTTPVSVAWAVMGSGLRPASAEDFGEASGRVLFESTDSSQQAIILQAAADTLNEGAEQFTLRISEMNGRSRVYSTAAVVVTTISDDPDDELRISIARSDSGDLIEGAAAEADRQADFVVRVGNSTATADLTIPLMVVHGADVSTGDYTLTPATMVTIAQGSTTGTVTLVVMDDNVNEGAESVQVALGGVRGALGAAVVDASASSASATIAGNDPIEVSVGRLAGDTGGAEGTTATFVVTLSGGESTSETVVDWDVLVSDDTGRATTADFVAISGQARVPAGETTGRINVQIADDDVAEAAETYTLTLSNPVGGGTGEVALGTTASAMAQIPANDQPLLSVTADPSEVAEGAGMVSFRVRFGDGMMMPSETVAVRYRFSATGTAMGAADDSGDYQYPAGYDTGTGSGMAVIGTDASSAAVSVVITDDMRVEADETIVLELVEIVSGGAVAMLSANTSATVTIENDDKLAVMASVSPASVDEMDEDTVVFTVSLQTDAMAPARTSEVRVSYTLTGTAIGDGTDYTDPSGYSASSGVVVLGVGSDSADVSITMRDDTLNEAAETVIFSLTGIVAGDTLAELRAADTTRTLVTIAASDPITVSVAREEGDTGGEEDDPNSNVRGSNPTGPTTATFVVTLSGGETTTDTMVGWAVVFGDGVGQASADDIATDTRSGEESIPAGSTTGEIEVQIAADDRPEIAESYMVRLTGIMGGGSGRITSGTTEVTAQIPANDPRRLSVYRRDSGPASVPEVDGQEMGFTVQWGDGGNDPSDTPPTTVTVSYRLSGSAAGGSDYRYPAGYDTDTDSGTLAIAISTYTGTLIMTVVGDTLDEDDETITFELLEVVMGAEVTTLPANTSASVTIEDDDKSSLSVAASAASVNEEDGDRIVFTLSLLNDGAPTTRVLARDVNVRYELSGDATGGGVDYSDPAGYGAGSGVLVLGAGEASSEVSVTVVDDAVRENDETIVFALTAIEAGADLVELRAADTTRVSVGINDDENVVRNFYVTATVVSVAEGTTLAYMIGYDGDLISPTTPVSVAWAVMGSGMRQASAADFEEASGRVLFESTDSSQQTIILQAAADALNEGVEQFTLRITEMDGRSRVYSTAREVVTTISDDPADELRISIVRSDSGDLIEGAAAEAERQADFVVRVGNATATAALTIPLRVVHGAGVSADDYTLTPATMVTIAQGATTGTVTLVVVDDNVNEGAESVQVALGGVMGALGAAVVDASASSASATIAANDPIEVSLARLAGDTGGVEGTTATFVVTLSGGESTLETVVDWDVSVSAAAGRAATADFVAVSGQARVPAGETTGRINVQIAGDDVAEAAETYTLTLRNLVGGGTGQVTLGTTASATAQIPANDPRRLSVYRRISDPASVPEVDGQEVGFTVQWGDGMGADIEPPTTVTVSYRLSGTAAGGSDYRYPAGYDTDTDTGTLMIAISTYTGTVMMTVVGDTLDEDDETVAFELLEVVMGAEVATLPANTSASITIEDDDKSSLAVAASAASVDEADGDRIVFTLSLLNDGMPTTRALARDVRVSYTLAGDATGGGVDYSDPDGYGAGSGVLVLRAGEVSSEVSITLVDDAGARGRRDACFCVDCD